MALHTCLRCGIYLPAKDSQLTVSDSTFHEIQALQFWLLSRRVRSLSRASECTCLPHLLAHFQSAYSHSNSRFRLLHAARTFWRHLAMLADLLIRKRNADRPGGLILRVNERTTGATQGFPRFHEHEKRNLVDPERYPQSLAYEVSELPSSINVGELSTTHSETPPQCPRLPVDANEGYVFRTPCRSLVGRYSKTVVWGQKAMQTSVKTQLL
jgi:hypothetical protein